MSRDGSIELPFPDQTRAYRLRIGELRQLQEKCDKGPMEILQALTSGRWRVDDIIQPIRLGLIGGGMPMADANKLVESTIHDGNFSQAIIFAVAVVQAAITGPPDEDIEQVGDEPPGKPKPPAGGSSSGSSTRKGRSSRGRRHRSMN